MGVQGLATFLRENRRALSNTQAFTNLPRSGNDGFTPLVVDGWSLIYALSADSGLPWVYGGEYESFAKCVQAIVKAWLSVGLEPYFVFDGPTPLAKIPTTIKRLTDTNIRNANIFFRTSAAARAAPSFLASTRIIPPFLLEACLDALRELQSQAASDEARVHVLMADGEADPFCVALAAALGGGLVVGMDSDFAVLCAEGYGGYIPIDEMIWQASGGEEVAPSAGGNDDGFRAVVSKQRIKRKSSGLIPPLSGPEPGDLSLVVTIYHPHTLASHLRLSPALLPLFSALVGNDFSNPANARKFFENRSSAVERVWKVARAVSAASLSGIKKGQQTSGRISGQGHRSGDTVLDVIHAAVTQLLVRPDLVASGEVDKIVDETVDAALECTIPPVGTLSSSSEMCALHSTEECPLAFVLGGSSSELLRAYRAGRLNRRLLSAVTMGIMLPKLFLEDPDQRSCAAVAKGTWSWVWAVLAAGGHVPSASDKQTTESRASIAPRSQADGDTDSRLDESELISVVEDFTATEPSVTSDPAGLASELVERLKGLAGSWDDVYDDGSGADGTEQAEKSLVQYVRRGLKLVPEPVVLERLSDLAPNISARGGSEGWARSERVEAFLEGMKSNTKLLRDAFEACLANLPGSGSASTLDSEPRPIDLGVLIWVCVLRCTVQASAESAGSTNGSGSAALVGKWKKAEACAFIASLTVPSPSSSSTPVDGSSALNPPSSDANTPTALPPLDTRTIQRVAQLLYAFDAGARLTEVVYLFEGEGTNGGASVAGAGVDGDSPGRNGADCIQDVIGRAVRMFSGRTVHAATPAPSVQVDEHVWALVCDGLDGNVWGHEPERAKTKVKSKAKSKSDGGVGGQGGKALGRGIGFGILAALGDE